MNKNKIWTKEEIEEYLKTKQGVERGIVKIYQLQTADERSCEETKENNGVGFNGFDAKYMSYLAKWIRSGKRLSGEHYVKAQKRIKKYAGQLTLIANGDINYKEAVM